MNARCLGLWPARVLQRRQRRAAAYGCPECGQSPLQTRFCIGAGCFQRCASAKTAPLWLTQHPYPRTLLMALLIEARTLGVLPSSHFIWLKPLDRALWYALNTAGRKVPFIESAGVFNQMQAERIASHHQCCLTEP